MKSFITSETEESKRVNATQQSMSINHNLPWTRSAEDILIARATTTAIERYIILKSESRLDIQ